MDAETHAFAVETTAEIEVLRQAVTFLIARGLQPMSPSERETVLQALEETVGDMAPDPNPASPEATRFFEAVAAAMPAHAGRFVGTMRRVLAENPPEAAAD